MGVLKGGTQGGYSGGSGAALLVRACMRVCVLACACMCKRGLYGHSCSTAATGGMYSSAVMGGRTRVLLRLSSFVRPSVPQVSYGPTAPPALRGLPGMCTRP
jgi:hypothetical protein